MTYTDQYLDSDQDVLMTKSHVDAPLIKFTEDFKSSSALEQNNYLVRLASSLNYALKLMQDERNAGLDAIALMQQQLTNAQQAVEIQKQIVNTNITQSNQRINELSTTVAQLTQAVKQRDAVIEELNS